MIASTISAISPEVLNMIKEGIDMTKKAEAETKIKEPAKKGEVKFCPECGAEAKKDAKFCAECEFQF